MNKFNIGDKVTNEFLCGMFEIVEINSGVDSEQYLCYQKGFDGHSGYKYSNKFRTEGKRYPTNEYWYASETFLEKIQSQFPEIRIITDGKHTTATKFINGEKVKEATVTLYYKDKFDFNVGAQEALKKLNNIPHLEWIDSGENLGEIGKNTKHTALFGEKLYVGDVVEFYDTITREKFIRIMCSCYPKYYSYRDNRQIVNGIKEQYQVMKIKSYTELKNGKIIRNQVKVVM